MKQILNDSDRSMLEKRIKEAEAETGAQIVMAIIKRSDNYTELPWKAFALGVSVTGLAIFFMDLLTPAWTTRTNILLSVVLILLTGTLLAFLTLLLPGFARLFLTKDRKETEPLQYAESLFLSHELFTSDCRRGVLLMISKFERQVVILPDKGVKATLNTEEMKNIISGMKTHLRQNELKSALEAGLEKLVTALKPSLSEGISKNELPDNIIEEEGV